MGADPRYLTLLPTPSVADGMGGHLSRSGARSDELLLPGVAKKLAEERLLPTPRVTQAGYADDGRGGKSLDVEARRGDRWGDYAPAIARWETVLGRPAPDPTEPGAKGNPRLSARFCEWLMGLPEGHVTSEDIGLTRNQALKALGNGVVPQQAAAATRAFLSDTGVAATPAAPTPTHDGQLLPTPAVNDMGEGKTVEAWDAWAAKMQAAHGNGNGHGKSLAIEAQRLVQHEGVEVE